MSPTIDSQRHPNIIATMLRIQRRTVSVDDTGVDEALHETPLRNPRDPLVAAFSNAATLTLIGQVRTHLANTIEDSSHATMEIHA
jgi:hypothetical protein